MNVSEANIVPMTSSQHKHSEHLRGRSSRASKEDEARAEVREKLLLKEAFKQADIAHKHDVNRGTVSRANKLNTAWLQQLSHEERATEVAAVLVKRFASSPAIAAAFAAARASLARMKAKGVLVRIGGKHDEY
jgi:hypothetical protein